jgi:hypothetical protein
MVDGRWWMVDGRWWIVDGGAAAVARERRSLVCLEGWSGASEPSGKLTRALEGNGLWIVACPGQGIPPYWIQIRPPAFRACCDRANGGQGEGSHAGGPGACEARASAINRGDGCDGGRRTSVLPIHGCKFSQTSRQAPSAVSKYSAGRAFLPPLCFLHFLISRARSHPFPASTAIRRRFPGCNSAADVNPRGRPQHAPSYRQAKRSSDFKV